MHNPPDPRLFDASSTFLVPLILIFSS